MWKNHRGFSLIEAVIVIALLGVLIGSSVAMVGYMRYANTKKVVEEVDKALSRLRLETMSQEEQQYLYIYYLSARSGYYMKLLAEDEEPKVGVDGSLDGNGTRLCGSSVEFFYTDPEGVYGKLNTADSYVRVAYKKNGLFQIEDKDESIDGTNVESIEISGNETFTIRLDYETGRHYSE